MKHFISMDQMRTEDIFAVLETAEKYRREGYKVDKQLFAANLFFEPSTRTKMSFQVAQRKLGMEVLDFHAEVSSVQKGESLYEDRKSTRLNSSHVATSYAVLCLKKEEHTS